MMTYFVSTLREINRSLDYDQAKVDGSTVSLISERNDYCNESGTQYYLRLAK